MNPGDRIDYSDPFAFYVLEQAQRMVMTDDRAELNRVLSQMLDEITEYWPWRHAGFAVLPHDRLLDVLLKEMAHS